MRQQILTHLKKHKLLIGIATTALFMTAIACYIASFYKKAQSHGPLTPTLRKPLIQTPYEILENYVANKVFLEADTKVPLFDEVYLDENQEDFIQHIKTRSKNYLIQHIKNRIIDLYDQNNTEPFNASGLFFHESDLEIKCKTALSQIIQSDMSIASSSSITILVEILKSGSHANYELNINLVIGYNPQGEKDGGLYSKHSNELTLLESKVPSI